MISVTATRHLCAGLLVLALSAVALVGCGSSSMGTVSTSTSTRLTPTTTADRPRPGAEAPYAATVISRVQPRQLAAFALLRTHPEGLPIAMQRILRGPVFGINWKLAQRIPVDSAGTYWLVPGSGHLCMLSQGVMGGIGVGTTCAGTAYAIAHGIADVSMTLPDARHPARLIVGVAPTGTKKVIVHTHGTISTIPVRREIFALRDSTVAAPDEISLR